MFSSSNTTALILPTISTPLSILDDNFTLSLTDSVFLKPTTNLSCNHLKYNYILQKPLFIIVRHISYNLHRCFIVPAIILNLCAFYILRRTRMNRSSSIAFYMQALALCDVAFFALRVMFSELSSFSANKHILTTGLCKFLVLMVNAVNYTTVWLIAAMNADKFLAVCLPLRVSDLLSRKKAYAVVLAVIICSMLVASVHASRTVLKGNGYCWLRDSHDEKVVLILDAFFCCFIPFVVISILNAAIFLALLRARREASQLHESTSSNQFRSSVNNRSRVQSQNLQITIMLITVSVTFFVLTLPNAIYYLLIILRVFIESWKAVKCDDDVYRNLDTYVRTSAVMHLLSESTSDLMHVVNFFLYFISGARFRTELRRLICDQLCRRCCQQPMKPFGTNLQANQRSFVRTNGVATVRSLASLPNARKQPSQYTTSSEQEKHTPGLSKSILKRTPCETIGMEENQKNECWKLLGHKQDIL